MKLLLLCACVVLANAGLAPIYSTKQRTVPNSWIVTVKDFSLVDQVADKIQDLISKSRLPPASMTKLRKLLPVITMKIPPHLIDDVRSIEGVQHLEQDAIATLAGSQFNPSWGLDRIDSRSGLDGYYNYNDNYQGSGVNVYMVDTGINTFHSCFGGRAHILFGNADDQGHGTHCSGTAVGDTFGIARQAHIYSVKVCFAGVGCPISTTLDGVDAILTHGGSIGGVVSMSLSGVSGNYPSFNQMAKTLWNAGYLLSHAAGNYNDNACNYSPQRQSQNLIVVGASESDDARAYYSNYGSCVPIFAPGSSILSADYSSSSGSIVYSGTSMACPHVTGAAAVAFGKISGASPQSVMDELINSSSKGYISDTNGSYNRLLYVAPN